jgi:hypothetical protein
MARVEVDRVAQSLAHHQTQILDEPERERVRAQRGSAIAGVAATGLASAGALSNLDENSILVLGLGLGALLAWLLAAALFIGATIRSRTHGVTDGLAEAPWAFAALFDGATVELAQIQRRTRDALAVAVVATLLTVASITAAAFDDSGESRDDKIAAAVESFDVEEAAEAATTKEATLLLTSAGATFIHRQCPKLDGPPRGRVDPDSLGENFVEVFFRAGVCRDTAQTLLIPTAHFIGTRTAGS